MRKINAILRELTFPLSIIIILFGLILLIFGICWYCLRDMVNSTNTMSIIANLGELNAYILVVGLISLGIGLYYLYSYLSKRKFILEEIRTNKRSEFMKKHKKIRSTVKQLPVKYQQMIKEKEQELKIK